MSNSLKTQKLSETTRFLSDVNTAWELTRDSIIKSCKDTVGFVQLNRKKWMSEETWQKVNHRHKLKEKGLNATTRQHPKKKRKPISQNRH